MRVANADKTVLHLVKGTTNVVEDGNGNHLFTKINGAQDTAKAAIYARDDMNIKGAGTLTVKGKFRNGIQCSNDLKRNLWKNLTDWGCVESCNHKMPVDFNI